MKNSFLMTIAVLTGVFGSESLFARQSGSTQHEFQGRRVPFDKDACLASLSPPKEVAGQRCLTSIAQCSAATLDQGKTKLDSPIIVTFSCVNHSDPIAVKRAGCARGIDPKRIHTDDIECTGDSHSVRAINP